MITDRGRGAVAVAAASVAALAVSLTGFGAPPTRAGTAVDPFTVRAVHATRSTGADVITWMVRQSDSPVTVTRADVPAGRAATDTLALAALRSGAADLGVIRASVLVDAGATSLKPLQAPMEITTEAQAYRVAADAVSHALMRDLSRIGLAGLALVPGPLEHPFSFDLPLTNPAAYRGSWIRTDPDSAAVPVLQALGATPTQLGDQRELGVVTDLYRATSSISRQAVVTRNVVLAVDFDVVVARRPALDGLTSAQEASLRALVSRAVGQALAARTPESEAFADWCATRNGSAVIATAPQLSQLAALVSTEAAEIASAPGAQPVIDRIRGLGAGTALTTDDTPCSRVPSADAAVQPITPTGDQHVLDGTWKMEGTRAYPNGRRRPDLDDPRGGIWQVVIVNGLGIETNQTADESCSFTLRISGAAVSADMDHSSSDDCFGLLTGTYQLRQDGTMLSFDWTHDSLGSGWLNAEKAFYRNGLTYIEPVRPGRRLPDGSAGD